MRNAAFLACLCVCLSHPSAFSADFQVDGHPFTLPDGYTLELAAGPPLVNRPITADFDEQGRLYVAESSGSNAPVKQQLQDKPHSILRLEDTDGDGRFDRRSVFAEDMMFPEGTLWYDGSLYVAAPPQIWKLTDTDDDGKADRREVWFDGKTLTGCANDLHGPYLGPDGLIYWCKGAFAEQTYERPDGQPPFVTRAAHIFRRKADGSGFIEPVMTGGMDNPVDVIFTPGGDRIFSCTFLQRPAGGYRDGLIHAVPGSVYGKVHDVIDEHPRPSPSVAPVLQHLGPAAACGLHRYESDVFPDSKNALFTCLFNMHKVTRTSLEPAGASFKASTEDFLVSTDLDVHPTDVLEDADGSLIVLNTGGWYKICCPTSQFPKPDVLGGIYRIRKVGAKPVDDPRGLKLEWAKASPKDLASRLGDSRPAVRDRARRQLQAIGFPALETLIDVIQHSEDPVARENAVWAMGAAGGEWAALARQLAEDDPDDNVRQAALNSAVAHRAPFPGHFEHVLASREGHSPRNRRVAAEGLGRLRQNRSVPQLLASLRDASDDWALENALISALIEIGDESLTAKGLTSNSEPIRRGALIALDQMGSKSLDPKQVAGFLESPDPRLREAASWVLGHHPEWGNALAGGLRERLLKKELSDQQRADLEAQLAQFAGSTEVEGLLAEVAGDQKAPREARTSALAAMAKSQRKQAPKSWVEAVAGALKEPDLVPRAVETALSLTVPKGSGEALDPLLKDVASDKGQPEALRISALAAMPGGAGTLSPNLFSLVIGQLDPARPVADRLTAADILGKAKLDQGQFLDLAATLGEAGPLEVEPLLKALERSGDPKVGLAVVKALDGAPALASLRTETLEPHLKPFGEKVQHEAQALYSAIEAAHANESAHLEAVLKDLPAGDVRRGQSVFHSSKTACATCHAIGHLGGRVGPDLTKIGKVRSDRDLLEAILFPSASFVRSYEPVTVATDNGLVLTGLLGKDSADEVVLVMGPDKEEHVPRDQIEEMRAAAVSVMPAGLEGQMSPQDLADLIAFLKACQ